MKKRKKRKNLFYVSLCFASAFVLWTVLVCVADVRPIGPMGSLVGFATLNGAVHGMMGVHWELYTLTDWLSLLPIGVMGGFAFLGLCQWIRRKKITRVDRSLLALGVFYATVAGLFLLFEVLCINYRPVLIEGCLEASYPSSTTLLVLTVMPTALMQMRERVRNRVIRRSIMTAGVLFTALMAVARLCSGVHWVTDIIGGVLLSVALVTAYASVIYDEEK